MSDMPCAFHITASPRAGERPGVIEPYSLERAREVNRFHASFPMYAKTPLTALQNTARELGVGNIYIKDESCRFGLNAFKALGCSYAVGRHLAARLGMSMEAMTYGTLVSEETRKALGPMTFIAATDGNHGRGVAWTARQLGQKAVIFMPKGTVPDRVRHIREEGADVSVTEYNYDATVRMANRLAEENGWLIVQDTDWDGYEEIPARIMQGYLTMGYEAYCQLPERPTHIFLQAGVGSMAGAMAGFFASVYKEEKPIITVVEPNGADCLYRTALAADGRLHAVEGELKSIMAGLACGEPCGIAWDVLEACADYFISCPDYAAAQGMRILADPVPGDAKIVSGESGASAFGCVTEILRDPALAPIKERLALNESSRLLFFSTEGATDGENYRRVLWDGAYPPQRG